MNKLSTRVYSGDPNDVKMGSNRSFGVVFIIVFGAIGIWAPPDLAFLKLSSFGIAILLVLATVCYPHVLTPFNRIWFKFGLILNRLLNPILMMILYYFTVTPIALLMRFFGSRPLDLEFDNTAESYWINRKPKGPSPETMKNQF